MVCAFVVVIVLCMCIYASSDASKPLMQTAIMTTADPSNAKAKCVVWSHTPHVASEISNLAQVHENIRLVGCGIAARCMRA